MLHLCPLSFWSVLRTHLQSFQNSAQQSPGLAGWLFGERQVNIPSWFPKGNCNIGAVSWHRQHGLCVLGGCGWPLMSQSCRTLAGSSTEWTLVFGSKFWDSLESLKFMFSWEEKKWCWWESGNPKNQEIGKSYILLYGDIHSPLPTGQTCKL